MKILNQFFNIAVLIMSFMLTDTFAAGETYSVSTTVLTRKNNFATALKPIQAKLDGLLSPNEFVTADFKIVLDQSSDPVSFNTQDEQLKTRAASVLYHLTKMKKFWDENSANTHTGQITVRLNVSDHSYRNMARAKNNNEIWFGVMEEVNISELENFVIPTPLANQLSGSESLINDFFGSQIRFSTLEYILHPENASTPLWQVYLISAAGIVLSNIAIKNLYRYDQLVQGKVYYHDTALVPETVYAQYTKIMFLNGRPHLTGLFILDHVADFFTAKMLKSKSINDMLDKVFYGAKKTSWFNRKKYDHRFNNDEFNQNSFIFQLLWDIDSKFPKVGQALILGSVAHLSSEPNIAKNLLNALLKSCDKACVNPFADKLTLFEIFQKKGF